MDVRASDADRLRVIAQLERHTAAGRLTLDEFTERADEVYASRTLGELAVITRDLPAEAVEPTQAAASRDSTVDSNARHLIIAFLVAVVVLVMLGLLMALR